LTVIETLTSPSINSEPGFENQGSWSDGYLLAKTDGEGVTVGPGTGNPNVFAQQFQVGTGPYVMLVARARSASEHPAKAHFQVNWLTEEGSFISVSQKDFEVASEEARTATFRARVPNGAMVGVIYVSPGGNGGAVQYLEMGIYPDPGLKPLPNTLRPASLGSAPHPAGPCRKNRLAGKRSAANGPGAKRPEGFWSNFEKRIPLCFIHIPKTAGHSVYSLLENNYAEQARVIPYLGVEVNIDTILNLSREEIGAAEAIAGHMPFGLHHYIGDCNYLSFLRDPLEMAISGYYFNMENPDAPGHRTEVPVNRSFLQFAECNDNIMTRFLMNSAFSRATYWLSAATNPNIRGTAFLGLECADPVSVRTVALQQWSSTWNPTSFPAPGAMNTIAVECSDDGFAADVRQVAELQLEQDRALHAYPIVTTESGRSWRIRALSDPQSARWGVVAMKFFELEQQAIPLLDHQRLVVRGAPICSDAMANYPASNAFDGHDRLAQSQVPPLALDMAHCEDAMNNLREHVVFGLVEKFDQSVEMLGKLLGWSYIANEKRNAGTVPRGTDILSRDELRKLAELNRYDVLLYDYARQLFRADLGHFRKLG
jgi:hypothetical protein